MKSPEDPPLIPPGWDLAPPDFVGVGAMKSGTTWWWFVVASHPSVVFPDNRPKELHFFTHYCQVKAIDPELYHRYFPRPFGSVTGEWSPGYMYDFWTPPMLRMVAPEAKLLVLLRDPVERFISGLAYRKERGGELTRTVFRHQFSRGLYWHQLQTLLAYFPQDQLLVLQYERCVADPAGEARRTFAFLGLDPDIWRPGEELARPVNPTVIPKPVIDKMTRDAIRRSYQPDITRLLADFPEIDGSLWRAVIK